MHDDMTSILKCYTEEAVSKSRKNKGPGKQNKNQEEKRLKLELNEINTTLEDEDSGSGSPLSSYTDEQLVKEMARRKSHRFRLAGAMRRIGNDNDESMDVSDQTCDEPSK